MDFLKQCVDFFLHLDKHLDYVIQSYGTFTYFILFAVIFCETGLVITPILPGDSLLFAVGAFSAQGSLNGFLSYFLLTVAALLGDNCNYWIGRFFGPKVFGKLVNKKYLNQTREYYEKHGVVTLVFLQFAPILRTFAPFVAGVGHMTYPKFAIFNLIGVLSWTTICIWSGYYFGNLEVVKNNFTLVILAIVAISLIPAFLQVLKFWTSGKKKR